MNQICKVCGEPAAGFHFGAFTCEGCKSFFGRSYNNLNSISDCKNNGECVINKKNRTACKACRLRKCLFVGMSKSGSRYGRRSNWFKIHCLLTEQKHHQQQHQQHQANMNNVQAILNPQVNVPPQHHQPLGLNLLGMASLPPPMIHLPRTREEMIMSGMDDCQQSASPSVSSPESQTSDGSVELSEVRRIPFFPNLLPGLLPPPGILFSPLYPGLLQPANNNTFLMRNQNSGVERKIRNLDRVLQEQLKASPVQADPPFQPHSPIQEQPLDLSLKSASERGSSPAQSERSSSVTNEVDEESLCSSGSSPTLLRRTPLDLTTRV